MDNWNDERDNNREALGEAEESPTPIDSQDDGLVDAQPVSADGYDNDTAEQSDGAEAITQGDATDEVTDNATDDVEETEGADADGEGDTDSNTVDNADNPLRVINDGEDDLSKGDESERRGRRGKQREPMPKKKKILIAVVAAVLIAAILVAIIVPVVFYVKDKIFVSSAEQFLSVDWSSGTKKYVYLKKDIVIEGDATLSGLIDIDLNKHSLRINGTLTINAEGGSMTVGTKKRKTA